MDLADPYHRKPFKRTSEKERLSKLRMMAKVTRVNLRSDVQTAELFQGVEAKFELATKLQQSRQFNRAAELYTECVGIYMQCGERQRSERSKLLARVCEGQHLILLSETSIRNKKFELALEQAISADSIFSITSTVMREFRPQGKQALKNARCSLAANLLAKCKILQDQLNLAEGTEAAGRAVELLKQADEQTALRDAYIVWSSARRKEARHAVAGAAAYPDQRLSASQQSLEILHEVGDVIGCCSARIDHALLLCDDGQLVEASEAAAKAFEEANQVNDGQSKALSLEVAAWIQLVAGRASCSRTLARRSRSLYRDITDEVGICRVNVLHASAGLWTAGNDAPPGQYGGDDGYGDAHLPWNSLPDDKYSPHNSSATDYHDGAQMLAKSTFSDASVSIASQSRIDVAAAGYGLDESPTQQAMEALNDPFLEKHVSLAARGVVYAGSLVDLQSHPQNLIEKQDAASSAKSLSALDGDISQAAKSGRWSQQCLLSSICADATGMTWPMQGWAIRSLCLCSAIPSILQQFVPWSGQANGHSEMPSHSNLSEIESRQQTDASFKLCEAVRSATFGLGAEALTKVCIPMSMQDGGISETLSGPQEGLDPVKEKEKEDRRLEAESEGILIPKDRRLYFPLLSSLVRCRKAHQECRRAGVKAEQQGRVYGEDGGWESVRRQDVIKWLQRAAEALVPAAKRVGRHTVIEQSKQACSASWLPDFVAGILASNQALDTLRVSHGNTVVQEQANWLQSVNIVKQSIDKLLSMRASGPAFRLKAEMAAALGRSGCNLSTLQRVDVGVDHLLDAGMLWICDGCGKPCSRHVFVCPLCCGTCFCNSCYSSNPAGTCHKATIMKRIPMLPHP